VKNYKSIEELKTKPLKFEFKKSRSFYLMTGEELTGNEHTCLIYEKEKKKLKILLLTLTHAVIKKWKYFHLWI
jgi:hypothetical protein